jgi:hypothetical protein
LLGSFQVPIVPLTGILFAMLFSTLTIQNASLAYKATLYRSDAPLSPQETCHNKSQFLLLFGESRRRKRFVFATLASADKGSAAANVSERERERVREWVSE